jgi:hypothetical protein
VTWGRCGRQPAHGGRVQAPAARQVSAPSGRQRQRLRYGHAFLDSYESKTGGTVVTSGSTDWDQGSGRPRPHIEQITHDVLNRPS